MKVVCPGCSSIIPASHIDLGAGWAKCDSCHEVFSLAGLVPGFAPRDSREQTSPDQPFDARIEVERSPSELQILVPPEGMTLPTWAVLVCAAIWLLGLIIGNSLMLFGEDMQPSPPFSTRLLFAVFSIPFLCVVALAMLGFVLWKARGTRTILLDRDGLTIVFRCLGYSRTRFIERDRLQQARPVHPGPNLNPMLMLWTFPFSLFQKNYAVEIVYRKGTISMSTSSDRWF